MKTPLSVLWAAGLVLLLAAPAILAEEPLSLTVEESAVSGNAPAVGASYGEPGGDSLMTIVDFYRRTAGTSDFGAWELHGDVTRRDDGGLFGETLRCRLGVETFMGSAYIILDTAADGTRTSAFDLLGESVPLSAFLPGNLEALRRLFAPLPMGIGRAVLVGSRAADNQSRVHYYYAHWSAQGGILANDTSSLPGIILGAAIAKLPFPYGDDKDVRHYKLSDVDVRLRYYPLFYSRDAATSFFGGNAKQDEMVMTVSGVVEVPRRFLMINTPHRYTFELKNVPLRLFVQRRLTAAPAAAPAAR